MLQLRRWPPTSISERHMGPRSGQLCHHTFLSHIFSFITPKYQAYLPYFRQLIPGFAHSYQPAYIPCNSFLHIPSCCSKSIVPHLTHPNRFVNESGVFAHRTTSPCDSLMIAAGTLSNIIPLPIFIIRYGDLSFGGPSRHFMSIGPLFSCFELASACRANGSLVTVLFQPLRQSCIPGSHILWDWFWWRAVTARLLVVGPDPKLDSLESKHIFESNEST